jgi:hypothetical protein
MRSVLTILLLLGGAASRIEVHVAAEKVTIDAAGAPIADILDRLAERTGMKIVYDGPRPRERVSVKIEAPSVAAAVASLLEGHSISSALTFAPNGRDVATLIIVRARAGARSTPDQPSSGTAPSVPLPVGTPEADPSADPAVAQPEPPAPLLELPAPLVPPLVSYPTPPSRHSDEHGH